MKIQGGHESEGSHERNKFSELTNKTLSKIKHKRSKRSNNNDICTFHDNTSPNYEWLLPGWVAKEQRMKSGRIYRV